MSPEWIKASCFACILVGILQGLMSSLGLASKSVHLLSHDAVSGKSQVLLHKTRKYSLLRIEMIRFVSPLTNARTWERGQISCFESKGSYFVPNSRHPDPEYRRFNENAASVSITQHKLFCLIKMFPTGFTSAAAVIIGSTQLTNLMGINKCQGGSNRSCSIFANLAHVVTNLPTARALSVAVGILSFVVLICFRRLGRMAGKRKAIWTKCGPLVVVVLGVLCAWLTSDWDELTSSVRPVQTIGAIPRGCKLN
jgi:MFS superfamily sulfate permease-like transporter